MRFTKGMLIALVLFSVITNSFGQVEERQRPEEWKNLVKGGKFIDLFQRIPPIGTLTEETWGADVVVPRYVANGIEDQEWSYWGGKIIYGNDGKYHLYVCRWREDSPKGHAEWPNSIVVHAVSDTQMGPFQVKEEIGKGHNPEIYQTETGEYVIFVTDGHYRSQSLNGPWEYGQFDFDARDREIIEGLSNLTFAKREDGSYLMICRGGGVWLSEDGIGTYNQVSDRRVYPAVDGRFEDPVIWKDNVQYHLIVNDWLGRIAFYQRSKDGIHWKTDPGEAYMPGITIYTDGTEEKWFKYERIKIFQDELGRATQANFAVIDTLKAEDKPNDTHSSKNIGIPLKVGRQMELINKKEITSNTKSIKVLLKAEQGFDPKKDLDISSLRFGASEEVNFGKGSKVLETKDVGNDLEITFSSEGNGFTKQNFAGKLLGRNIQGEMIFAYCKLPWVDYLEPELSARKPLISSDNKTITVVIENFGQVKSKGSQVEIWMDKAGEEVLLAKGNVSALSSFGSVEVEMDYKLALTRGESVKLLVSVFESKDDGETFEISTVVN